MIRHCAISLALGVFGALMVAFPRPSQGVYYGIHYSDVQERYLRGLTDKNIPVFIASCAHPEGKAFAIIPMGAREGRYVELYWIEPEMKDPILGNYADFTLSPRVEIFNLFMGAIGSWLLRQEVLGNLIKSPFKLFLPSQFDTILDMNTTGRCSAVFDRNQ